MTRCSLLASVLFGLTIANPVFAQVNLSWKLKEGAAFIVEEKIAAKTKITVSGKTSTEEQTQTRVSHFVVKSITPQNIVLEQKITKWESNITGGLAGDQDDTKLMQEVCEGVVFTIHLSPRGSITRFEGYDEFLKKLAAKDSAEAKKLKAVAGEDLLRAPLVQIFDIMPNGPVKKGQSWEHGNIVPMGPMGIFRMDTTFTLLGPQKGYEEIATKSILSFTPGKADAAELGFKILKIDLSKKEGIGKVIFDNVRGRTVSQELTLPLAGAMTVELAGMQVEVQFDGEEKRTIRLLEPQKK